MSGEEMQGRSIVMSSAAKARHSRVKHCEGKVQYCKVMQRQGIVSYCKGEVKSCNAKVRRGIVTLGQSKVWRRDAKAK